MLSTIVTIKRGNKVKKVGIVTIYDMTNYGNRLQNYAVCKSFEKEGAYAETLVCEKPIPFLKYIKKRLLSEIHAHTLPIYLISDLGYIRWCKFEKFTRKYIPTRIIYTEDLYLPNKINNEYAEFVAGSDQIWNYEFPGRSGNYAIHSKDYFLTFADKNKRNSLSASFGITDVKEEWRQRYCSWLESFSKLSVREKEAAQLIQRLIGRTAQVLIDPTMYLTESDWRKISSKPKRIDFSEPYLLEYFLSTNSNYDNSIQSMADNLHLKRYKLWDVSFRELFVTSPDEFIYLIDHATLICTDSYHAAVFAILFDKPFIVYERGNMNSRIDTLMQTFCLEERKYSKVTKESILKVNFDRSKEILKIKRNDYKKYIRSIIAESNIL